MNQFIAANRYRRYPLVQTAATTISDRILVDLQLVVSTKFSVFESPTTGVKLSAIVRSAGSATFTFTIISTQLTGYKLVGVVSESAADDTRVILALQDSGSTPHPELGYGILMVGVAGDLTSLGGTTTINDWVDRATIRLNVTNDQLVIRVANANRPGPSVCAETQGAEEVIQLQGRLVETVSDCYESTSAPSEDTTQRHISPTITGDTTTSVPMVPPSSTHDRYQNDTIATITTHLVDIEDQIPDLPTDYDADTDTGPIDSQRVLTTGHNVDLTGDVLNNIVRFKYRLNGGLGMDCSGVEGYQDLGTLAYSCIKSINGVHSVGGQINLVAGGGCSLIPDEAGHKLIVLMNAQHLGQVAP